MLISAMFAFGGLIAGSIGTALIIRNNRKHFDSALAKYPDLKRSVEDAVKEIKGNLK